MVAFRGSPDIHTIKRVKIVCIKVFTMTESCTCTEPMQDFRFDTHYTPLPQQKKKKNIVKNQNDYWN